MSTSITEAQVIAFLKDRALEIKQKFGADKYAHASMEVSLYHVGMDSPASARVSIGSGAMGPHIYAPTFAEAWLEAADKTPEKRAELKRAEAARLIAEADALAPVVTQ